MLPGARRGSVIGFSWNNPFLSTAALAGFNTLYAISASECIDLIDWRARPRPKELSDERMNDVCAQGEPQRSSRRSSRSEDLNVGGIGTHAEGSIVCLADDHLTWSCIRDSLPAASSRLGELGATRLTCGASARSIVARGATRISSGALEKQIRLVGPVRVNLGA
jgi:hypothetical protein